MHTHANARLTQRGRLRLVSQHLKHHRSLTELAAEAGISLRCAYKWLARYRSGGAAALADRRSVSRTQRWTLDPQQLLQAVDLRHQRCTLRRIARAIKAPLSTVGRVMNRLGLGLGQPPGGNQQAQKQHSSRPRQAPVGREAIHGQGREIDQPRANKETARQQRSLQMGMGEGQGGQQ
jgi:transposase